MSKYNAKRCVVQGITFASQKEGKRYQELLVIEKAGWIKDLVLQPQFYLQEAFRDSSGRKWRPIVYVADFQYWSDGARVVEDVKGMKTPAYRIKAKLFRFKYPGIKFIES